MSIRIDMCTQGSAGGASRTATARGGLRRTLCAWLCATAIALAPAAAIALAPSSAEASRGGEIAKQARLGVGSFFASILYAPVKLVYATGGLVVGGLAYLVTAGDGDAAKTILVPSTLGDYVVTPKQLTGDEPLEFIGREPGYSEPDPATIARAPESEVAARTADSWETESSSAPEGW